MCVAHPASIALAEGYDALGYLTDIAWDSSGTPTGKKVMIFEVKVAGDRWRIHTEPAVEAQNSIGYFEGGLGANTSVVMVTAFAQTPRPADPRLQALRAETQRTRRDDVYFKNKPIPVPAALSNLLERSAALAKSDSANIVNNNAIATTLQGKYPSVNSSHVAFLWFAFTPPSKEADGKDPMLLQIWDDGNPLTHRFHHASWKQFPEPPHLVSSVRFQWVGKQLAPDGRWTEINTSDATQPLGTAARYEVTTVTNLEGLVIPLEFTLTRYSTRQTGEENPATVSTIQASVVSISRLPPAESLEVALPAETFVSDYRLSGKGLRGGSLKYMLSSNSPPSVEELKRKATYNQAFVAAHDSEAGRAGVRWVLFVSLALLPLVFILLFRRLRRE